MFFGIAFGPIVGFITGFVGNILADMLSGYGFWIWWDLGNGIMGLIPGLFAALIFLYNEKKSILLGEVSVVLGVALGMAVASISEMWVSGADMNTVIFANFLPSFLTNIVWGLILLPILMVAYAAIVQRRPTIDRLSSSSFPISCLSYQLPVLATKWTGISYELSAKIK